MKYIFPTLCLFIIGCDSESDEYQGEFKEVKWIYYGNSDNKYMIGCF